MPITIPNYGTAANDRQSILYGQDVDALAVGIAGDGVWYGCDVTGQAVPDMTIAISAGEVRIGGVNYAVSAGNATISAADSTNPRIDVISVNTSGAVVVTAGTPAASPVPPALPASSAILAFVDVPAGDTAIATAQRTDKRVLLPSGQYARAKTGSTVAYDLPGVTSIGYTETVDLQGDTLYYNPIFVRRPLTVDRIACDVSGFADAGDLLRMGLYRADLDLQPVGAPMIDQEVDVSTTGVKEASITSIVVYPGIYLVTAHPSDLVRLRGVYAGNIAGHNPSLGNDRYIAGLTKSRSYAALPTPGVAWDTLTYNYQPAWGYGVYLRVLSVG